MRGRRWQGLGAKPWVSGRAAVGDDQAVAAAAGPALSVPRRAPAGRPPGATQGILFVLHTGIGWEHLPQELGFGSGMTAWRRLHAWQEAGRLGQAPPGVAWSGCTQPGARSIGAARSWTPLSTGKRGAGSGRASRPGPAQAQQAPRPDRRPRSPAGVVCDRRQPQRHHATGPSWDASSVRGPSGRPQAPASRRRRPRLRPRQVPPASCERAASATRSHDAKPSTAPASALSAGSSNAPSATSTTSADCSSAPTAPRPPTTRYSASLPACSATPDSTDSLRF